MRRYRGELKPRNLELRRCHWCSKPSGGFYCIEHTKRRNENDRKRKELERSFEKRNARRSL